MSSEARRFSVELAFRRLRMGVLGCCWLVGLALAAQLVIWSLARYTDMRHETRVPTAPEAQIVKGENETAVGNLRASMPLVAGAKLHNDEPAVDANQVYSKYDEIFRNAGTLAAAFGKLGYMMLMPLLAVGVFLSAGSATAGVHKSVSAFTWSLVLAILVLPVGSIVDWSPLTGAFYNYDAMIASIDAVPAAAAGEGEGLKDSSTMAFARYLMLPAVCLIGTMLVGFRFSLGVEQSLMHRETRDFDPVLERETSNRSATSLHGGGGRSSGALSRIISEPMTSTPRPNGSPLPNMPPAPAKGDERMPAATKVSAGEAPRRLI